MLAMYRIVYSLTELLLMASTVPIVQYPLDKTGTSPTNKVIGEIRTANSRTDRAFVPQGGPFYTESMIITNVATGQPLVPVDDYVLVQPFAQAALRTGKDVQCIVWLLTDTPITVSMTYQVVGGEYSFNIGALQDLINQIENDDRPVAWGDVIGRPTAYPPAPHIHDIGDTYGWEYVVYELEGIRNAILVGDEASHDELRQQMQSIKADLEAAIGAVSDRLDDHVNDFSNPHKVTKAQVGLDLVQNYGIATTAEANAGSATNKYMTPALTWAAATTVTNSLLNPHLNDFNNPHQVTKAQVGLGNVQNYGVATTAEAQAGVVSDKYMTPALTKSAIMGMVGDAFNAHVSNYSNPHQVTKAQVGLSLVNNYDVATDAEAQAGVVKTKYMTPYATALTVNALVGNNLNNHITNYNNPHQVTKAQVGLGNIPNAITRSRSINNDTTLLTAGGMYDHVNSGDHDARYVPYATVSRDGSMYVTGGVAYVAVGGAWRQFWPAQWQ